MTRWLVLLGEFDRRHGCSTQPVPAGPLLAGTGERMDLAMCMDAVFAATDRGG